MNLQPLRRRLLTACAAVVLAAGCAHAPPPVPDVRPLLHDEWFAPSAANTDPGRVLALSDAMRSYADNELRALIAHRDPRRVLIEALHERGQLQLAYDAERTGNVAKN
jgi:hypothetical protein